MKLVIILSILFVGLSYADLPTEVPDLDDFEAVKERCDKKGGAGTYEKVKRAKDETQTCLQGLINITKVKDEIEESKKTGSMDEVFGKYCGKRPQFTECIKKSINAIQPCLEESEKQAINVTSNILSQIGDFVCFKDGDRIAMFVAEGGMECLNSRAEGIKNCVNKTIKFNPATFSPNSIPNLTIDKKKCDDLKVIQDCVVKDLEDNCSDSTPANIIDALFRFVKRTTCKDIKRKRSISVKRQIRSAIAKTHVQFRAELEEKLKATCKKNGDDDSYDKLVAAFNNSIICLKQYKLFVTPSNVYQQSFTNCTIPVKKALENCLNEDGKYYPDFILEILQSTLGFMYANMNNILAAGQSSTEFANCMRSINAEIPQKELLKCAQQSSIADDGNIITIPPKSEVCGNIKNFEVCFSNIVKNLCIRDIKIQKFFGDLFNALEAPCHKKATSNEA